MSPATIDALMAALERFKQDLESPAVVTVSEASRRSGRPVSTITAWCRQGRVGRRRGKRWVTTQAEIPRLGGIA